MKCANWFKRAGLHITSVTLYQNQVSLHKEVFMPRWLQWTLIPMKYFLVCIEFWIKQVEKLCNIIASSIPILLSWGKNVVYAKNIKSEQRELRSSSQSLESTQPQTINSLLPEQICGARRDFLEAVDLAAFYLL